MKIKWIAPVLLLMLMPALLGIAAFSLPDLYQESYYAELPAMTDQLYQAQGKRLILIGGSNIAFGVDAPLLERLLREKDFDYTVCPYGLYAAVGSSAMLSLSEGTLREGDTVVLAIEPTSDTLSTYFGATAFLKCAERDPALALRLNPDQRRRVIGNFLPYLQEKSTAVHSGSLPLAEGVYAKATFDADCSMIYPRPGNEMALGYDPSKPIALDSLTIEPAFAAQVNAYCANARKKGAEVYWSFSPMNRSAVAGDPEAGVAAYYALCDTAFDCPVISNPLDYVMDSGWFYDSNFHLNTAGAEVRTVKLAGELLAQWGCYAPLDAELPVMPAPVRQAAAQSADTGGFLFELSGNGQAYVLSGLTEQGAEQTVLRVPSAFQGKPVAAIAQDAFRNADCVEEIHIPESVSSLPDAVFSACDSLRRLVLTHQSAPCAITSHSLDGTEDLQILVPAEAYPWYRDGYGCEENRWQSYLKQIVTY